MPLSFPASPDDLRTAWSTLVWGALPSVATDGCNVSAFPNSFRGREQSQLILFRISNRIPATQCVLAVTRSRSTGACRDGPRACGEGFVLQEIPVGSNEAFSQHSRRFPSESGQITAVGQFP